MSYEDLEKAMENKNDPKLSKIFRNKREKFTQNESDTSLHI